MPTSITTAPGFTNSGVTNAGRPIAATRMSASRAIAGRSRVREWQIVTVAFLCSSNAAIGLPTMSERPITTACLPSIGIFARTSSSMTPAGVHGANPSRFCTTRPAEIGLKPSTSLAGSIASNTCCSASLPSDFGSGDCTRMPSKRESWLKRSHDAEQRRERGRARQSLEMHAHAGVFGRLQLVADIDFRRRIVADEDDGERRRSAELLLDVGDARRELVADLLGHGFAVEEGRSHGDSLV